jgi:hypothetical protein
MALDIPATDLRAAIEVRQPNARCIAVVMNTPHS